MPKAFGVRPQVATIDFLTGTTFQVTTIDFLMTTFLYLA